MFIIRQLTLIALCTPTLGLATDAGTKNFSLSMGYFTQAGSVTSGNNKIDLDSTGYSIIGNVDVSESVMIGGSYISGTTTNSTAEFDRTHAYLSAGYLLSNNLNLAEGNGSKSGVGISVSTDEIFFTGGVLETRGADVFWKSVFGLGSNLSGSVAISAPIDNRGKVFTGSIGATYSLNDTNGIMLEYSSYSAVDKHNASTKSSLSGLTLSYVIRK
jgi:hypothetical protein